MTPRAQRVIEKAAEAINDCHGTPEEPTSMTWARWLEDAAKPDESDTYEPEFAREWIEARRKEARASLLAALEEIAAHEQDHTAWLYLDKLIEELKTQ